MQLVGKHLQRQSAFAPMFRNARESDVHTHGSLREAKSPLTPSSRSLRQCTLLFVITCSAHERALSKTLANRKVHEAFLLVSAPSGCWRSSGAAWHAATRACRLNADAAAVHTALSTRTAKLQQRVVDKVFRFCPEPALTKKSSASQTNWPRRQTASGCTHINKSSSAAVEP